MNIYAKRTLVYENEISEIDFKLHEEFGFDYEKHEDFLIEGASTGYADAYPIKIEEIIKELENMQKAGATHVEIGYHCDHIGYIFEGYKIEQMSTDDVFQYEEKERLKYEKEQKRLELLKQLQELDREVIAIKTETEDDLPF